MCGALNSFLTFLFLILYLNQFDVIKLGSCQSLSETVVESCDAKLKQLQVDLVTHRQEEEARSESLQEQIDRLREVLMSKIWSKLDKTNKNINNLLSNVSTAKSSTQYPASCYNALKENGNQNGVYNVDLRISDLGKMPVHCIKDPQRALPWMIVLRRQDNTTDFDRSWHEYKSGFGDLYGNFFIGLEALHKLTYSQPHELWVQLEDFDGVKRYAKYGVFAVGNEDEQYKLTELSNFFGDAGDSLSVHKGKPFTTREKAGQKSCSDDFKSGWWFDNCFASNLNGLYLYGKLEKDGGLSWGGFRGHQYSLKYAHMAIRPANDQ